MSDESFDAYAWPVKETRPDSFYEGLMLDEDRDAGSRYIPDRELIDAVNVARVLGKPLLVVGEPGTGKTRLAASIAWQLGLAGPFKFVAKSSSSARDLFYGYDALGRFYAAQVQSKPDAVPVMPGMPVPRAQNPLDFVTYSALGKAILRAHDRKDVDAFLPDAAKGFLPGGQFYHPGPAQRSVVVIDEIDKAPRDFPNDLLDEIDTLSFRVSEVNPDRATKPIEEASLKPLIVITSNQERQLPEAFLRRCVFFPISPPGRRPASAAIDPTYKPGYTIEDIVDRHIGSKLNGKATEQLFASAIDLFERLRRADAQIQKKPATAELLDWVQALSRAGASHAKSLREQPAFAERTLSALLKTDDDRKAGRAVLGRWLGEVPKST
ncbi:MAG: MoxR family ATPase [Hyphomicrobiaceae bacterium]